MGRLLSLRDRCAHYVVITVALILAVLPFDGTYAQALTSYHIGNSLTFDSSVIPGQGGFGMATEAGLSWGTGWHIDCGSSLETIVGDPEGQCVAPGLSGTYTGALANNTWDAVTLQPFSGTPQGEYLAAKQLILQTANASTFYIYESWDTLSQSTPSFYDNWSDPAPVDPLGVFRRIDSHFDWVVDQLRSDPDLAGVDLRVIPVSQVLAELELRILASDLPGFTSVSQLYRDEFHMNNLGRFVAANTVVATLFGQSTQGFPFNNDFLLSFGTGPVPITPETQLLVQQVVWDVVSHHPDTGVLAGDLNADGLVGIDDLNLVLSNWNQATPISTPADVDGDGFIGITDLNVVLGNWNAGTPPPADAVIPEPGTLADLLVAGIALELWRNKLLTQRNV